MRILTNPQTITSAPRNQQVHSNLSDQITKTANAGTAAEFAKIFSFKSRVGQKFYLPNRTKVKGSVERGYATVISLKKADGNEISGAAQLFIAVQGPGDVAPDFIARLSYQTFRDLDTKAQRSDEYRGRLAQSCDLNTDDAASMPRLLTIPEDHELQVWVNNTTDVVDWSKSYVEFPGFEETK